MSEKPKRPWFRFHLLTAMEIMVVSGAFLLVNFRQYDIDSVSVFDERITCGWGWPVCLLKRYSSWGQELYSWDARGILYDLGVAAVCLFALAFVSETLIRRREGRKT